MRCYENMTGICDYLLRMLLNYRYDYHEYETSSIRKSIVFLLFYIRDDGSSFFNEVSTEQNVVEFSSSMFDLRICLHQIAIRLAYE